MDDEYDLFCVPVESKTKDGRAIDENDVKQKGRSKKRCGWPPKNDANHIILHDSSHHHQPQKPFEPKTVLSSPWLRHNIVMTMKGEQRKKRPGYHREGHIGSF